MVKVSVSGKLIFPCSFGDSFSHAVKCDEEQVKIVKALRSSQLTSCHFGQASSFDAIRDGKPAV